MTKRQINMGVTEEGIRDSKAGEFLKDMDAFIAKMSTVKKGQYKALNLMIKFMRDAAEKNALPFDECCVKVTHEYDIKPMLYSLSIRLPEYFYYTDTNGMDCLTVK